MAETEAVVFDEKSGISVDEQKEILSKIDGIAEKNRRSLSEGAPAVKAKKSGAVFPLVINIAALVILAGGGLFLVSFYGEKDAQVRTGGAVYNLTEQALIEEIRKDTAIKIASKEREIAAIYSRLEEVDAQLSQIYSSHQGLNGEQLADQERLLSLQITYRTDLAALQEERSQILEDSRSREAKLRAQLEERAREFTAAQEKSSSELNSAMSELERLTNEQERIAAIDAQMAGGLTNISSLVQNGRYDQAAQSVENLRLFCNTNTYTSYRSYQSRKEFYNQAINSVETMINEVYKSGGVTPSQQFDLQVKNSQLEETIAEMQKTIDSFSTGSSDQARRLRELEESVSSLRALNSSLERTVAEKDRTVSSLETEKTGLTQTVTELRTANSAQEQEIARLRNQINNILQAAMQE